MASDLERKKFKAQAVGWGEMGSNSGIWGLLIDVLKKAFSDQIGE